MTDLTKLSAAKLEALYTKRGDIVSEINKEFIAAGRGMWRPNNEIKEAAAAGDEMSLRYFKAAETFYEVVAEQDARKRYHGSLKPIRRAA